MRGGHLVSGGHGDLHRLLHPPRQHHQQSHRVMTLMDLVKVMPTHAVKVKMVIHTEDQLPHGQ